MDKVSDYRIDDSRLMINQKQRSRTRIYQFDDSIGDSLDNNTS